MSFAICCIVSEHFFTIFGPLLFALFGVALNLIKLPVLKEGAKAPLYVE
jgi:hypothetical protein